MIPFVQKLILKVEFLFLVLFICVPVYSQSQQGRVISSETKEGVAFVNIGIIGKNIGTVSDKSGYFAIALESIYDNDSLRFSMIGYESKTFLTGDFKKSSITEVFLNPRSYTLHEVTVTYRKPKEIILGTPVLSNELRSGFASNNLGSELGVKIHTRGRVKLRDINFNVAICTYDSVTYRLNIYQSKGEDEYKNILREPVYISFTKDKIDKVITFDLWKYSILIEGDVLITLELYKDLGEGRLLFHTQFFTGTTYHRKASEGKWSMASGLVGMYLHGQLLR
jgi:hypothetical protein